MLGDKPNILIVDDSRSTLLRIGDLLEGFHANLIMSSSAVEALHILETIDVSIIVSDVNMPDLNGFEFAKNLRANVKFANIPLIFISGSYTEQMYQNYGLELGALDYILKDKLDETLTKKIRNILEFVRFHKQLKLDLKINALRDLKDDCANNCEIIQSTLAASSLKSQMLMVLTHQIRSPLSAILHATELLQINKEKNIEEYNDKAVEWINKAVVNINNLLEHNTLSLKAISGQIICDFSYVDLFHLFSEIIDEISVANPCVNIGIRYKNIKALTYLIDPYHLKIIFENLLTNAIKYSNKSKEIKVEIEIFEFNLIISVKDYGIGIPDTLYDNIFEPFKRGENVNKIKGTGIGLAIVKNIVKALKGEISFESVLDEGTTFKVKFPIKENIYE